MYYKKNPVVIIDGNLYLYRSYFTFQNINPKKENPFGAIYGVLKMIKNIFIKYNNTKKMIIIFDSSKKTFRNKIYKQYKKNRTNMPINLYTQISPLLKILKNIGIKTLSIPGIEADDIIGSFANKLENEGEKILIFSHDKDMLQLITNNINICYTKNNKIIDKIQIKKKYGIQPKELIDLLALMGDRSDNIPGVPKIGIKTALFLLKHFSNINNIYSNLEKIEFLRFRNIKNIVIQLKNHKNLAFISYKLAKIKLDFPINIKSEEILINKQNILKALSDAIEKYKI